ncbi:hypothetical protein HY485_01945 [Candidatus Woesearchaeota archaeon]|nr:hypothetical protein [Candidatus Woesearchaeota archaeon]
MNTRAQLKMFETIGVLIVFFILLAIGMSVYFFLQKTSYAKDIEHARQLEALALMQKMLYLPELDCNFLQTTQDNCIEKLKLEALRDLLQRDANAKQDYYPTFGRSAIKIVPVYPTGNDITLYQNTPQKYKQMFKTHTPIILKDTVNNINTFAYIEITSYIPEEYAREE